MRILLTNDDGVHAPGLAAIGRRLRDTDHDLVVAAPTGDLSGSGTSLGTFEDGAVIGSEPVELAALPGTEAYRVDAPPAFAVLAACSGAFGPPPDFVVSGVNPGHNTGRMLLHSSTVGAAIAAAAAGRSALAVSCGEPPTGRFDTAAEVAVAALGLFDEHLPRRTVLNVNVPDVDVADIVGVRRARLGRLSTFTMSIERAPGGLRLRRRVNADLLRDDRNHDADSALVVTGHVTLTCLLGGTEDLTRAPELDLLATRLAARLAAVVPVER